MKTRRKSKAISCSAEKPAHGSAVASSRICTERRKLQKRLDLKTVVSKAKRLHSQRNRNAKRKEQKQERIAMTDTATTQKSVVKRYRNRLKIVTAISHFSRSRILTLLPAERSQDSGKKCGMHGKEVLRNSRNPHISQTEQRPQGKPQRQQSSRKASHFVSAESQKRKRQSRRRDHTLSATMKSLKKSSPAKHLRTTQKNL